MQAGYQFLRSLLGGMFVLVLAAELAAHGAEELPAASNVLHRVVERAQLVARASQTNHYAYEKRTVTAELDENERVIKSTEKIYEVMVIGGLPFPRLLKIQGLELTAKELEKENERETAFRQKMMRATAPHLTPSSASNGESGEATKSAHTTRGKKREGMVTKEIVDRFEFKVAKREVIDGRATLVLLFAPRPGAPEKTIEDKVYRHVSGTVWVDEKEAEVTRLDASVLNPIPLGWFGALGALNKFQATVERSRMPDGVWVNRRSSFWIVARKFLSTMRSKTTEESSRFRRE